MNKLFHVPSCPPATKQSSMTDSGEERAAAMTKDTKDKVGSSKHPTPTACTGVLHMLCHIQLSQRVAHCDRWLKHTDITSDVWTWALSSKVAALCLFSVGG